MIVFVMLLLTVIVKTEQELAHALVILELLLPVTAKADKAIVLSFQVVHLIPPHLRILVRVSQETPQAVCANQDLLNHALVILELLLPVTAKAGQELTIVFVILEQVPVTVKAEQEIVAVLVMADVLVM